TPSSLFTGGSLKLFVRSFHLYHVKLNDPVPRGLFALRDPFTDPEELQYINTGSLTAEEEGYEVYLTALIPVAESWASAINGNNKAIIKRK
ncbi:MAG TPA: hypothetical protein PKM69_02240, partial [Bacteroidales bacterium]|nr:hypothetical protein [Bacteroidales bacterium]